MTSIPDIRIGRRVPDAMKDIALAVAELVHAHTPLDSVRIYVKSAATYMLTVVPKGRTTLVTLEFRTHDQIETRADIVVDLIKAYDKELDEADIRNAKPITVERAIAAYVHPAGDGDWFRTAIHHLMRRTTLGRHGGILPAWPEIAFNIDDTMRHNPHGGIDFIGRGTPRLTGQQLTLSAGTPILRSLDNVEGMPVDQIVDHDLIKGAGLIAQRAWKSDTRDKAFGRITIMLQSDPMPLNDAAALVDTMRLRNGIDSVYMSRTQFRQKDEDYTRPAGTNPEKPNKYQCSDTLEREYNPVETDAPPLPVIPDITQDRRLASLMAFIKAKGLEGEWREALIKKEAERQQVATPEVIVSRTEEDGRRRHDALINITPWLITAALEDIVHLLAIDADNLNEDTSDRVLMNDICEACTPWRTDTDDSNYSSSPEYWEYDVYMPHLHQDVRAMLSARRPALLARLAGRMTADT